MKCLSVRSPWADMIVTPKKAHWIGRKWIENRNWRTGYTGRLLIHQSGPDAAIIGEVRLLGCLSTVGYEYETGPEVLTRLYREANSLYLSANLVTPHTIDKNDDGFAELDAFYWWVLSNPVKYRHPITYPGRLRLWNLPKHLERLLPPTPEYAKPKRRERKIRPGIHRTGK